MDYTDITQAWTILASQASASSGYQLPTDFSNILPDAIAYAEGRIYREMTFLATRAQDSSLTFSGNTRSLDLTAMTTIIVVPEGLSIITPKGAIPAAGRRVPVLEASLDWIDIMWPVESDTADPLTKLDEWCWAMKDATTIVVGPTPNDTFGAEITGLFQPTPLSTTNPTTYLTLVYPAFFICAGMIFITGYMRNFGAQADNPQMANSWETQYQKLAVSTRLEEERRRGQGTGWSNQQATPLATPARTA